MRFFFKSPRYSEDMDLDVRDVEIYALKDKTMEILRHSLFLNALNSFGIKEIVPPDMVRAKQTETTQRFKIHLISSSGEDLFTKIEFSRRGLKGNAVVETVSEAILKNYKFAPLIVPHYDLETAVFQKTEALASRSVVQARDIFDLYILSAQSDDMTEKHFKTKISGKTKARERIFEVSFKQFRDMVMSYLSPDDQKIYNSQSLWDDIRLRVSDFIIY